MMKMPGREAISFSLKALLVLTFFATSISVLWTISWSHSQRIEKLETTLNEQQNEILNLESEIAKRSDLSTGKLVASLHPFSPEPRILQDGERNVEVGVWEITSSFNEALQIDRLSYLTPGKEAVLEYRLYRGVNGINKTPLSAIPGHWENFTRDFNDISIIIPPNSSIDFAIVVDVAESRNSTDQPISVTLTSGVATGLQTGSQILLENTVPARMHRLARSN